MVSVIFPAAGQGKRLGAGKNKVLVELAGTPVLLRTLRRFSEVAEIDQLIVVVGAGEIEEVTALLAKEISLKPYVVAIGGSERQYSIDNGLKMLSPEAEIVLVHDAARPLVSKEVIEAVIASARNNGGAIAAVPEKNTIKEVNEAGEVKATFDRSRLWAVQTPQGFRRDIILAAYAKAKAEGFLGTDDAGLVERLGQRVVVVESDYGNIKITTPEDMTIATALLTRDSETRRSGGIT